MLDHHSYACPRLSLAVAVTSWREERGQTESAVNGPALPSLDDKVAAEIQQEVGVPPAPVGRRDYMRRQVTGVPWVAPRLRHPGVEEEHPPEDCVGGPGTLQDWHHIEFVFPCGAGHAG